MKTAKEVCLAIVECFINFGNKRFLLLVTSAPIKVTCLFKSFLFLYLNFSKRSENVSYGPKIIKITSEFKDIRKVFPFNKLDFLALKDQLPNLNIFDMPT